MTSPSSDSELDKAINQFAMSATFWGLDKGLDCPSDMDSSGVRSKVVGELKAAINQYIAQEIEAVIGGDYSFTDDAFPTEHEKRVVDAMNKLMSRQRTRATQRGYKMKGG